MGNRANQVPCVPVCCRESAWRALNVAVASLDSSQGLLRAAVAVAAHQLDHADYREVNATIDRYARRVRRSVRGPQSQALLAHLHHLLFDTLGFCGDTDDYFNPLNSYVPAALQLRRGLPITLSLIYKCVAERLGFEVQGIGLPGHFIVGVRDYRATLLVDPFHAGRLLTHDDARELIHELFGDDLPWSEDLLTPVSNRHWIGRMLQNLLHVFSEAEQYENVAATIEMQMLLWPDQTMLQRDLALVLARIGRTSEASRWLRCYLRGNPDDPIRDDLQHLLAAMS
jgi:regulator of sirC expression with transglutaminase-like and TPR domain